jgi:outer membrane lipoprotein-sorting protein
MFRIKDWLMKKILWIVVPLLTLLLYGSTFAAMSNREILKKADQARGNLHGITWEVVVTSTENDRTTTMTFDVKARRFDVLAENLAPPKYKGNKLLMLSGNMWFHRPGLSKPVPVSRRHKLLGLAVYGDIASTNYAEDYEVASVGDDTVKEEACYLFDLKARTKQSTYDRIKYWISKDRMVGVKAEYFTVSGKIFKSAVMEYDNRVTIDGETRPFISRITIRDELMTDDITTLDFTRPDFQKLPDYIFNLNLLKR